MITSTLTPQPQPDLATYAIDKLTLLQTYTRKQYEAAGGPLVPFDTTRPEQDWWDDNATAGVYSYTGISSPGTGAQSLTSFVSPNGKIPNFTGLPGYLKWTVAPTAAVSPHAGGAAPTAVDPNTLSSADQAQELLTLLGGASVVDQGEESLTLPGVGQIVFPIEYGTETRRAYAVTLANGKQFNVGTALAQMNGLLAGFNGVKSLGIGAPGHFVADPTQVSGLSWEPTVLSDGSASSLPALPVPCRALNADGAVNEVLSTTLTLGILGSQQTVIQRTDLMPATPVVSANESDTPLAIDTNNKITALFNLIVPKV